MKAPECVGRKKGSTRRTKKVTIAHKEVVENRKLKNESNFVDRKFVSGLESGDNPLAGNKAGILKLRDQNRPCQENEPSAEIHEIISAKKPPKCSPSRSAINHSKTRLEDNKFSKEELICKVENASGESPDQYAVAADNSVRSCILSSPKSCLTERVESPEVVVPLVAPPPPGYFIRDDISTDDEQTTICCNQHGEKILDIVPMCTFGYQGWSAMPYYCEVSPDCDSNCSPRSSPSQSTCVIRKREPPAKKTKKSKKRRRSTSKARDHSDLKKIFIDGNVVKSKIKPGVDLKRGIALKQGSKKESAQALRYKQKVINPKNPKLFQTMGNLPVSNDSVLYYYEPHGKHVAGKGRKKSFTQGKNNSRKGAKSNGNTSKKKQASNKGKQDDILYLNTNGNANNSDIDLSDIKNTKGTDMAAAGSCTRQSGITNLPNSYETDLSDTVGNILPGDYSSLYFEDFDSCFKRKILSDSGTKEGARETGELGKPTETPNGPFGINAVVEDFIQKACKEEAEYEQSLASEKLESISKYTEDSVDTLGTAGGNDAIVNMQLKSHKVIMKKNTQTEKEKSKFQALPKIISKVTNPKLDTQTSLRQMKKKSLSTPNIAVARSAKEDGAPLDVENVILSPMTSILQAQKDKGETENILCRSQTSPQLAYVTVDAINMDNMSVPHKTESITDAVDESLTPQLNEDEGMDSGKQKERGRIKKSLKTNSILRKPTTTSQDDKRTLSQSIKVQTKIKPLISFTKSHSLSPISKKRGGQGNSGQANKKMNDFPKKAGKKAKKKVRIVVDVNGIQADKIPTDDDFCEFRDDPCQGYDEIDDNHAYLAGLLEKCKLENEQFQNDECGEYRKMEMSTDLDIQSEKAESGEIGYCGFSETNSDQESLPSSPQIREIAPCIVKMTKEKKHKMKSHKQIEKEHKEKVQAVEKERLQAEKGWDNNFMVQKEDSKTKVVLKKKRYQLKKACDQRSEVDDFSLLERLRNSTDVDVACRRAASQTGNKFQKTLGTKKRPHSPKQSTKKGADKWILEQDPREGTSVDAPGFNKKVYGIKSTQSGQSVCIPKQTTKENLLNPNSNTVQAQRVKLARDNFSKFSRKKSPSPERYTSSAVDQVSPMASRSTDLDVAFSYRLSPGRTNAIGRLARRDSKIGQSSKYRSKSESEEYKQKMVDPNSKQGHGSDRLQHPDPMDMNVLNLGLNWMIQGLMKRLSIFNKKEETEEPMSSPVQDNTRDFEAAQI